MTKRIIYFLLALFWAGEVWGGEVIGDFEYELSKLSPVEERTAILIGASTNLSGNVVIPTKVKSLTYEFTVVAISKNVFKDHKYITSITIPESVTNIGEYAFYGCWSLGGVHLPESITEIKGSTFGDCTNLKNINIPTSVNHIGPSAFYNCGLESITISENVTSIGLRAFYLCKKLTNISIESPTPPTLGEDAFDSTPATSIEVPCGTAETYKNAEGWKDQGKTFDADKINFAILLSSNIPEWGSAKVTHTACEPLEVTVTATPASDEFAFAEWNDGITGNPRTVALDKDTALTAMFRPVGDSTKLKVDGLRYLFDLAAHTAVVIENADGPYSLTEVSIPDTVVMDGDKYAVTAISDTAFANCDSLKSISIHEGVTSIGNRAFSSCRNLSAIDIPTSVTSIGDYAFYGNTTLQSVTLPEGITSIAYGTFQGCYGLKSISIPKGVTTIGSQAFLLCGLEEITIPENVTDVEQMAFHECPNLTSVTISGGTTIIGEDAFYECPKLTSVHISGDTTIIKKYAFSRCTKLDSVIISKGVTKIGNYVFSRNTEMKSITSLEDAEVSFGDYAFSECSNLTTVSIAKGEGRIGEYCFLRCNNLNSIVIPKGITSIGKYAFWSSPSLTNVTISDGVETIECGAFYQCEKLESVIISGSVKAIDSFAFVRCASLTNAVISEGVTSIGFEAFSNCSKLESITLPQSLTTIGGRAFSLCSGLTSVVVPKNVTSIGDAAFNSSWNLTSVTIEAETPPAVGENLFSNPTSIHVPCGAVEAYENAEGWKELDVTFFSSEHAITLASSNTERGRAEVAHAACGETEATIAATPACGGYAFAKWSDGNTDNPRTLLLDKDTALTAEFVETELCNEDGLWYKLDRKARTACVTQNPEGAYKQKHIINIPESIKLCGKKYMVTAIDSFAFANWECDGLKLITVYATTPPALGKEAMADVKAITVPCIAVDVYAEADGWKDLDVSMGTHSGDLTLKVNNRDWGRTEPVPDGTESCPSMKRTIVAVPTSDKYVFSKWSDGDTQNPRQFDVSKENNLTAVFIPVEELPTQKVGDLWYRLDPAARTASVIRNEKDPYTLTTATIPATIKTDGMEYEVTKIDSFVFAGCGNLASITVKAATPPALGKGALGSITNVLVPCATIDAYSEAEEWKALGVSIAGLEAEYTITLASNNTEWGEATVTKSASCQSLQTTITATPASDEIAFVKWSDGNVNNPRSLTLEKDTALTAIFRPADELRSEKVGNLWYRFDFAAQTAVIFRNEEDPYTLTEVTIPATIEMNGKKLTVAIDTFAFAGCDKLASVTIEANTPPALGKGAFDGVPVTTITVPCGADEKYKNADGWKELDVTFAMQLTEQYTITLTSNNTKWGTVKVTDSAACPIQQATISASIAIMEVAFEKWSDGVAQNPRTVVLDKDTALTAIFVRLTDLPKQKIGDLWYRLIPASHTAFVIRNTADPYTQTEINIPASVEHDGEEYAVTMLNDSAFYNCKNLKSVTIPESVKRIASRVFYGCSSLTSVEFPDNLNIIGAYAFGDCKVLTSITLPKAMTGLGWGAFRYCSNLTSISIEAPVPPTIDEMAFGNVGAKSIKVPCGTEEAYESAEGWKSLNKTFVALPFETEISATILEGETYRKNGFVESEAGEYTLRLTSANGCDSIVTLRLTVIEEPVEGFKGTIADGENSSVNFTSIDDLKSILTGNTIVSFSEEIPTEWAELPNVVVNGAAKSIVLSNNGGAYTYGSEISAESVEFHLYPTVSASNSGGWMSVAIPFTGTPDAAPHLKGNAKTDGSYWAKRFVGSTDSALVFATMDEALFEANVPYIFAFPGEKAGKNAFEGHLTISATNTTVQSAEQVLTEGGNYDMVSIYGGKSEANAYLINPEGTRFALTDDPAESQPFSAYAVRNEATFAAPMLRAFGTRLRSLAILDADEIGFTAAPELPSAATLAVYAEEGDIVIRASKAGTTAVYSMNGQTVKASVIYGEGETRISGLCAGTYVVASRKVVLK